MNANTQEARIDAAVDNLASAGFAVSPDMLKPELLALLIAEQHRRETSGELIEAGIGRGVGRSEGGGLRHAQSSWFNCDSDAERQFLAFAERMRLAINRRLMLGLFEFEAQFLHYPPGGFYRRHVDALHGERARVVSLIAYLNEDWLPEDGGTLAIWLPGGQGEPAVEVTPAAGTVVLMLSEEIPHEARISNRHRRAIAGWYRLNPSSGDRADPGR
jgi:SM-20-related protein